MRVSFKTVLAVVAVTLAALVVGVLIGTKVFAQSNKICRGVVVSGIDLSGMTDDESRQALRSYAKSKSSQTLTLRASNHSWSGTLGGLGVVLKWEDAAHKAWLIGRGGGVVERSRDVLGIGGDKNLDIVVAVNPAVLDSTLNKVARAVDRPARDAAVRMSGGAFTIKAEQDGYKLDKQAAYTAVRHAVASGYETVDLPLKVDKARVSAADLRAINGLLAQYTTRFKTYQRDRTYNLKLAAKALNGIVLKPGEKFSYNAIVGPRVAERGYRNAPIFVKGKVEPGLGGGVCQVSTTLYNAVLLAGLKVNERYHHSRVVVYAPAGRDATVAYGSRDFKFTNSSSSPIYINSYVQGSQLHIALYGSVQDRAVVKVWSSSSAYGGARVPVTVTDSTLGPGKRKVTDKGSRGVSAVVRRSITRNGVTVTEVVSRDVYPPQPRLISVGPTPVRKTASAPPPDAVPATNTTPRQD